MSDERGVVDPFVAYQIQQTLNLYTHVFDDRRWDMLAEIFCADLVYDMRAFGRPLLRGIEELTAAMREKPPLVIAHHTVNPVIYNHHGTTRVRSKFLGLVDEHCVVSGDYSDVFVETPSGWRISERTASARSVAGNGGLSWTGQEKAC